MYEQLRTCGNCIGYDVWPEDPYNVGRCLLFDAVDSIKRDTCAGGVKKEDVCNYGLLLSQQISLTKVGIARIVNTNPEDFFGETIRAEDIDLKVVMRIYEI